MDEDNNLNLILMLKAVCSARNKEEQSSVEFSFPPGGPSEACL